MTMNKDMLDLAAWSIETAKSAGADGSRVNINSERSVEVSYRERKPENIKEAATKEMNIEIFANNRYSSQSTSDLRKDALKDFISKAVATTKLLAEDKFRTLPDPDYYKGKAKLDIASVDTSFKKVTPEDRHVMAKTIEDACLARGGSKVVSVTAEFDDSHGESVMLASNGFEGYNEYTSYVGGAVMTVQDEGDRRPNGYYYVQGITRKELPKPEVIGARAAKRTLDLIGAKKIKTETLPIIIENQIVGRIGNGLFAAMFGRSIQQKQSFLAEKKGTKIGSDKLTLIDDPLIAGGLGSRLYDGDGIAAKKRVMIDEGVLKNFYIDWYYSRKLGWEPTTGGSSNLIVPPGNRSVREIIKDLGKGILITGFIGGNSNSTTGDMSIGIIGTLFEGGELVQPVAEMNIAGNHLEIWHKLVEVANDPWMYSQFRTPSLVFTDVVVSGI
jgi:PmbA protein